MASDLEQARPAVQTVDAGLPSSEEPDAPDSGDQRYSGMVVWAVASLLTLGYLVFGSIPAIRYDYNEALNMLFVDRGREAILHIWSYQVRHLPSVGSELAVQVVFVASVLVFVVGVIGMLWVLLVSPAEAPDDMTDAA